MYAIEWTRSTGEHGIFSLRFSNKAAAERTIEATKKLDNAKRQGGLFRYKVIEI